ncbi:glycosyltransferase family 4 protein [Kitasatospora sp. NPDC085895]|uniref:glycosyltransferase family 4 protein n=1 Tax=Kitasatospora sp. NPDC085895 TaxID=3155057 RepID=UPI00344F76D1
MYLTILHAAQPVDGGVARVVVDLVRGQREAGHRVLLACPPGGLLGTEAAAAGAELLDWPAGRAPGPATAGEVRRLRRVVRAAEPDVLHLHSAKAGLAGRLAVRGSVPTVFQPHAWSFAAVEGAVARAVLSWERYAARWAHALVCVSEQERADGAAAGLAAAWRVVPNGVDLEHHVPAGAADRRAARAALGLAGAGLDPEAPLAVCLGRLCRQKGQDVLLDAWPRVAEAVPGAGLALVGGGPDEAVLAERVRALPGPRRVLMAGGVGDPRPWLAAADLVVLPSRWEGMALAPLEAMAAARPVLLTDVPGARECLPPGGAVPPVPPGDAAALAERLVEELADPDACARRGGLARAYVADRHDVRRTVEQVEAVYRAVLPARPSGRPDSRVPQGF